MLKKIGDRGIAPSSYVSSVMTTEDQRLVDIAIALDAIKLAMLESANLLKRHDEGIRIQNLRIRDEMENIRARSC